MPDVEYRYESIDFRWDDVKARSNLQKHGISFEDAASAFDDDNAIYYFDKKHSQHEERFILIGYGIISNLVSVCHCYVEPHESIDPVVRIISARKAKYKELQDYMNRS